MSYGDTPETIAASHAEMRRWVRFGILAFLGLIALIWLWMLATPRYNLYRKNTEKQAVIAEQRAKSEAAEFAARSKVTQAKAKRDAEVIRAEGVAEANRIIAESITDDYLRYEFIQNFADAGESVIYVPTDGLLPVTEAGRAVDQGADE